MEEISHNMCDFEPSPVTGIGKGAEWHPHGYLGSDRAAQAPMHAREDDGVTSLHVAAASGSVACVRALACIPPDVTSHDGATPMHAAALMARDDVVRALINRGACVDARDNDQQTPLMLAARWGHASTVRALLDAGADSGARDAHGATALHMAAALGRPETTITLLEYNASHCTRDENGRSPLHMACAGGMAGCACALVEAGARPTVRDEANRTPVHCAAEAGSLACAMVVVAKSHAVLRAVDQAHRSASGVAAIAGHERVAAMLAACGAWSTAYTPAALKEHAMERRASLSWLAVGRATHVVRAMLAWETSKVNRVRVVARAFGALTDQNVSLEAIREAFYIVMIERADAAPGCHDMRAFRRGRNDAARARKDAARRVAYALFSKVPKQRVSKHSTELSGSESESYS